MGIRRLLAAGAPRALPAGLAVIALLVGGCGDGDDAGADGPHQVTITEDGYEPAELEIEVGDRVTFVNRAELPGSAKDDPTGAIDVSPAPGPTKHDGSEIARATRRGFATHSLFQNERQTVIFGVPRTYRYGSAFNPDIEGTIRVTRPGE